MEVDVLLLTQEEKEIYAERNLKLIKSVASQFYSANSWINFDDLFEVAQEGFVKALNSYDTQKSTKFSTYAVTCMKNELCGFLRLNRVKGLKGEISYEGGMTNSFGEYSEGLNLENVLTFDEIDGVENRVLLKEDMQLVLEEINKLNPLEKIIITERFGLEDGIPKTQKELAEKYKMSQANVSRLQNTALSNLHIRLKDKIFLERDEYYNKGIS